MPEASVYESSFFSGSQQFPFQPADLLERDAVECKSPDSHARRQVELKDSQKRHRCSWAADEPLLRLYHDTEWGVPQRDGRILWETLMLEGFQAGLAWIMVLRKREAFRKAFASFDASRVARFTARDILRLMGNDGIIRARAKIEATIRGAQIYCEMEDTGQGFSDYCWSFTDGEPLLGDGRRWAASSALSERISKDMKRRGFKFVGPTIVYAWMQAVGLLNDHSLKCFRRKQLELKGRARRRT